ncbi:acetate/propionate family kinase [Mesorhizobium sp. M1C.F.Ca.ET.193.01.1.1]|uniref:acetate/propionate family kinase n=1 Tax=unclassified Mesorhizobium TaxID=325217 RepID=UPI000FD20AA5|nr:MULTISPECIES: acetate/propionate family kinase [unclassified Mesorhizobium]TGS99034.1 acetate/propionate family kinase [bacterium M00.F.Ca.ET.177.01.1.1]TGQ53124.1 acetate/propionate family kinase [Mesorhizobium sp. M1C.F.Ca.ET.210.01.1.1]TGQ70403.1 acetate/propionate family kinase [Mesorhizobium sp. M1C.F.Ca.ET.212.01.1.1]TGR06732.1 acetate/propionate family kinase [Mesorhizobium sp. M1C.F.Ca.ET.204.01.1.1]TGR27255.1 acetate/propionate family kinase [Mesorhizobium sp. M1C.F.Ca.ET.196.01.1.
MSDAILVLNGGSSSLKFALFQRREELHLLVRGSVSSIGSHPRLHIASTAFSPEIDRSLGDGPIDIAKAFEAVASFLAGHGFLHQIGKVGHRIVHGGREFARATRLDQRTLDVLHGLEPLAPIHQSINLEIVDLASHLLPEAEQVGCFDTAFHAARPELAKIYGVPHEMSEQGIVSYGFHGQNYSHVAAKLHDRYGAVAGGRAIVAHLGSGASLCAMKAGASLATTMGFSTLDGLVMSTRCGAIDPGVLLHLLQDRKLSPEELTTLLYEQSGLLGVSGISGDMQTLLASKDLAAARAVDLFVYRIGREIGSLAAALGGLDTLVFTAGIGEHAPQIRQRICEAAGWLGVMLDDDLNRSREELVSAASSRVDVLVIPADEERAVAMELLNLETAVTG